MLKSSLLCTFALGCALFVGCNDEETKTPPAKPATTTPPATKPISDKVDAVGAKVDDVSKKVDALDAKVDDAAKKNADDAGKKVDAAKTDAAKTDAPKVDVPKVDAPKIDAPKVENK